MPLPWLNVEHDVGPAAFHIFKDGIKCFGNGERIALASEVLLAREACHILSKGIGRLLQYHHKPGTEIKLN